MKKALQKVLDTFFRQFSSTAELVDRLIDSREHPQEILLLLCGRLDALASGSVREGEPGAKSFSHFITAHGRRRQLFESISIGDLYYEVNYHRWLLPGALAKAGRLHRFSHIDDGILHLLTESDIPLTRQAVLRRNRALLDPAFFRALWVLPPCRISCEVLGVPPAQLHRGISFSSYRKGQSPC